MPPLKVTHYLLNPNSDDGKSKCAYLMTYGFGLHNPNDLALSLYLHADKANFVGIKSTPWGLKFLFDGPIPAPNGLDAWLLTVWQVKAGSDGTALFVTSRPSRW